MAVYLVNKHPSSASQDQLDKSLFMHQSLERKERASGCDILMNETFHYLPSLFNFCFSPSLHLLSSFFPPSRSLSSHLFQDMWQRGRKGRTRRGGCSNKGEEKMADGHSEQCLSRLWCMNWWNVWSVINVSVITLKGNCMGNCTKLELVCVYVCVWCVHLLSESLLIHLSIGIVDCGGGTEDQEPWHLSELKSIGQLIHCESVSFIQYKAGSQQRLLHGTCRAGLGCNLLLSVNSEPQYSLSSKTSVTVTRKFPLTCPHGSRLCVFFPDFHWWLSAPNIIAINLIVSDWQKATGDTHTGATLNSSNFYW